MKIEQFEFFAETMGDVNEVKEELDDFEVKEEKQDPLSLDPIGFPGKYIN